MKIHLNMVQASRIDYDYEHDYDYESGYGLGVPMLNSGNNRSTFTALSSAATARLYDARAKGLKAWLSPRMFHPIIQRGHERLRSAGGAIPIDP
jgi:hypothetical protein